MTDKELLEMAAKAAGIAGKWERDTAYIQERYYFNVPYDNQGMLTGFEWNPLTSDSDALRLAVRLRLDVLFDAEDCQNPYVEVVANIPGRESQPWAAETMKYNPAAATRRAIVRAAAEIGKAL